MDLPAGASYKQQQQQTPVPMREAWEMRVGSLGPEVSLEEGTAAHSSILACESHGQRSLED